MAGISVSDYRVYEPNGNLKLIATEVTFPDGMTVFLDDRYERAEAIRRALLMRRKYLMAKVNDDEFLGIAPEDMN